MVSENAAKMSKKTQNVMTIIERILYLFLFQCSNNGNWENSVKERKIKSTRKYKVAEVKSSTHQLA